MASVTYTFSINGVPRPGVHTISTDPLPPWARVGQKFQDFRGGISDVSAVDSTKRQLTLASNGQDFTIVTVDEMSAYIMQGWWKPLPAKVTGPARCQCGWVEPDYVDNVPGWKCWGCRGGFNP